MCIRDRGLWQEVPQNPHPVCGGAPGRHGKTGFYLLYQWWGEIQTHAAPKKLLMNRGFSIVGDFSCKGWTTWGPLKLFGGTNKGRPNEEDLEEARVFARGLKEKYI